MSLPAEAMVNIMTLVGAQFLYDPKELKQTLWTVFEVSPFRYFVNDARAQLRYWKGCDTAWAETLPHRRQGRTITRLFFSEHDGQTLREITTAFSALENLQHLEISCNFNFARLCQDPAVVATMSKLTSLRISNQRQTPESLGCNFLSEPVRLILHALHIPNLQRVEAFTCIFDCPLLAINVMLGLPRCSFPSVKMLELGGSGRDSYDSRTLASMLQSLPALQQLMLRPYGTSHTSLSLPWPARSGYLRFGSDVLGRTSSMVEAMQVPMNRLFRSGSQLEKVSLLGVADKQADP